jgi:hypothetical protein
MATEFWGAMSVEGKIRPPEAAILIIEGRLAAEPAAVAAVAPFAK